MRRWLVVLAVVLVGVPLLCVAWFFFEADHRITHKRDAAARELPRLLEALDTRMGDVLSSPLFARPEGDDAGEFLNAQLEFRPQPPPRELLSKACVDLIKKYSEKVEELPVEQLNDCDTSILTELRRYDRWSLTPGARSALPAGPRDVELMPEFYVLTLIAKIHLVKAHARGDFAAAIDDVRHLAKLYFAHEYLLSTMLGIALLNVTQNVATSLKEPFTAIESKEALLALRQRLYVSMYSINALAEPALAQTTAGAPRFVRCVLITEQSYMRTVTSLPADADCWFENARFELAHPWQRDEEDAFVALSPPAMLGGWIVHAVYPSGVRQLEKDLRAADQLPTDDGWARTESEYLGRLLGH